MDDPRIFSTSEWGARQVDSTFAKAEAKGIVIHNTGGSGDSRPPLTGNAERDKAFGVARGIQNYHIDHNGWQDTGQHFLVSRGGVILEGRHGSLAAAREGQVVQAAHAGRQTLPAYNRRWFGIENEGLYATVDDMPDAQFAVLVELCAWLSFKGEFQSLNIIGHQQVKKLDGTTVQTNCPGLLMSRLSDLREKVHARKLQMMQDGN